MLPVLRLCCPARYTSLLHLRVASAQKCGRSTSMTFSSTLNIVQQTCHKICLFYVAQRPLRHGMCSSLTTP